MDERSRLPWSDPAWRTSARRWIEDRSAEAGLRLIGRPRARHLRPWSAVLRVSTGDGPIFFKATASTLANEAALTPFLADCAGDLVLRPLAVDAERRWMLMPAGGRRMRGTVRGAALVEHWERLLPRYAELQKATRDAAARLLALGALDRRPTSLVNQLEVYASDPAATRVGRPGGLTGDEVRRLRSSLPRIAAEARATESAGIGASIQHDDLHDGNVFVAAGGHRIFDWGDAAVSHPFASLVVTISSYRHRSGYDGDAPQVRRLRDAYLEAWTGERSRSQLEETFAAVERIYPLMRALTWNAAYGEVPPDFEDEHRGGGAEWVRAYLAATERG